MPSFVSPPPPSSFSPPESFDDLCALIQPLLSAYVDEETTPAEAEQVAAHLAGGCSRCEDEWAFLRLSRTAIARSSVRMAVPAGLSERIARATYARPTLADQVRALLRPAPARAAVGGFALAAGLAVVLITSRGGGGGQDAARPGVPVAGAPPARRPLPGGNPAVAGGDVPARIVVAKTPAAGMPHPKSAPLQQDAVTRPRPPVVLPRDEDGARSVKQTPALLAKHDGNGRAHPGASLRPNAGVRVVAAPPAVPAPRMVVEAAPRAAAAAPPPTAPPVVPAPAPPLSAPPPPRVAVAAPASNPSVTMTASVASGALKEEGGRLRIVQHRSSASLPAVEAEPVERVRNAETRVASGYQELGQGQGGSGLLVGSR